MFLDSLELRYGALGGAARGGENKSSNRTCSPNKRTPPRAIESASERTGKRDGGASVGDDRHAMRVKSGAVSSAIWQVLDLISQWRDPYDRTERLQHIHTAGQNLRWGTPGLGTPAPAPGPLFESDSAPRKAGAQGPKRKGREIRYAYGLRRDKKKIIRCITRGAVACRGGVVSPGPRGSPEIGLVEARLALARGPGPGCSPSCSAARNSINSAPSSAARSSAMRFLAMCPTTASPS